MGMFGGKKKKKQDQGEDRPPPIKLEAIGQTSQQEEQIALLQSKQSPGFLIAQRLRTVRSADQILVLKDGRIVERGKHEELIAEDGLYRQIYDLELRDQEEAFERERERLAAIDMKPIEEIPAAPAPVAGGSD